MAKFLLLVVLWGCTPTIPPFQEKSHIAIDTYNNILQYCYILLLEKGEWECQHLPPSPLLVTYTPSPPKSPLEKAAPIVDTLKEVGEIAGPLLLPALVGKSLSD